MFNTSNAGCPETCPTAERRHTVYYSLQMPIVERRVVCFPL